MNSWAVSFDPLLPGVWPCVAMGMLFVLLLVGEWRRKLSSKGLRMGALIGLMIALAGLFFRPGRMVNESGKPIILLTKGYDVRVADSLVRAGEFSVLRTPEAASFPGAGQLSNVRSLTKVGPQIAHLLGEGLPVEALDYFEPGFRFWPAPAPIGVTSLPVPDNIRPGAVFSLLGKVNARPGWKLLFSGPKGRLDSLVLTGGEQDFSFSTILVVAGRFSYYLNLEDSAGRSVQEYTVPVEVSQPRQLNILFLSQYPTFEVRHLKNLLAGQGHALALRYKVSREQFRFEFVNTPTQPFSNLGRAGLDQFDLLIADQGSISELGAAERSVLEQAVRAGLGLLTMLNEKPASTWEKTVLPVLVRSGGEDTLSIALPTGSIALQTAGLRLAEAAETYPIWRTNKGSLAAAYAYVGDGVSGAVAWQDSYRLALKGQNIAHANLWASVVESIARKPTVCCDLQWVSAPPFYADRPMQFTLVSAVDELPELLHEGAQVPLVEDARLDNVWHGTIWPKRAGWDSLVVGGPDRSQYFFVQPVTAWSSIATTNRLLANTVAEKNDTGQKKASSLERKPFSAGIFYALLLLSCGALWLAPKL